MPLASLTPKAVADLFHGLSPEDQKACVQQLGFRAEAIFLLLHELSPTEQFRFTEMIFQESIWQCFPWLIDHAIDVVKQHPHASKEELHALINDATKRSMEQYDAAHAVLAEARLKEQRDRKSDPEIIRRNVEICDLRKKDAKTWSFRNLAKKYGMRWQSVQRIVAEELKWRSLAAALPPIG